MYRLHARALTNPIYIICTGDYDYEDFDADGDNDDGNDEEHNSEDEARSTPVRLRTRCAFKELPSLLTFINIACSHIPVE